MFFFSCEDSTERQLQDFINVESSLEIGIFPNISYTGSPGSIKVNFPIKYENLIKGPFELITEPHSDITTLTLNDSTTFILLKDSTGFKWRSLRKDYVGIVVNVMENQITDFDGRTDIGIFIYNRKQKDYFVVVSAKKSGTPLRINELFGTLHMNEPDSKALR